MDWSNIVFLIEKQALHVTLERILIESLKKHKPKLGLNGGMAFPAHGKILAILRLKVNIIPMLSPENFFYG